MIKARSFTGRSFLLTIALGAVILAFGGCGDKDDPPVPQSNKNMKFTISVTGLSLADGDQVRLQLVGTTVAGTDNTLWKVNGVVRNNEKGIALTQTELAAGAVFVVESAIPLAQTNVDISAVNANAAFTVKLKNEMNNSVKEDITMPVTAQYVKSWSY